MISADIGARKKAGELNAYKTATPDQIAASSAQALFENVNRRTRHDGAAGFGPADGAVTLDETLSLARSTGPSSPCS
jgi:hypothetical protein